jgi:hypothetical protein
VFGYSQEIRKFRVIYPGFLIKIEVSFLEKIRFLTQGSNDQIETKKNNFDSCTQGPYLGTESNYFILDQGLYRKGLRFILNALFKRNQ